MDFTTYEDYAMDIGKLGDVFYHNLMHFLRMRPIDNEFDLQGVIDDLNILVDNIQMEIEMVSTRPIENDQDVISPQDKVLDWNGTPVKIVQFNDTKLVVAGPLSILESPCIKDIYTMDSNLVVELEDGYDIKFMPKYVEIYHNGKFIKNRNRNDVVMMRFHQKDGYHFTQGGAQDYL